MNELSSSLLVSGQEQQMYLQYTTWVVGKLPSILNSKNNHQPPRDYCCILIEKREEIDPPGHRTNVPALSLEKAHRCWCHTPIKFNSRHGSYLARIDHQLLLHERPKKERVGNIW